MFTCTIASTEYPIALIPPYDASVTGRQQQNDKDLRFHRVREQPRSKSEFISVHSIVRGALLVPDFEKSSDYLVHDLVDADMFLRMKEMQTGKLQ